MMLRRWSVIGAVVVLVLTFTQTPARADEGSPFGSFDQAYAGPARVQVSGWAADPDTSDPIEVHVYVDDVFYVAAPADQPYPGVGNKGFFITTALQYGVHQVCVYALSVGAGDNALLGCKTVTQGPDPFGHLDGITLSGGAPTAEGWAIDPDTFDAIEVRIYVDGVFAGSGAADQPSPDVSQVYPMWGPASPGSPDRHRYSIPLSMTDGPHSVCAYGINVPPGTNPLLGCVSFVARSDPFGALDIAVANTLRNLVILHGWAIDPDSGDQIDVHLYADGRPVGVMTANRYRPDIAAAFGTSVDHGYAGELQVPAGATTLCAYGINTGAGANALLGCRWIDWSGNPIGEVRPALYPCGSGHAVTMWAIDPDTFAYLHIDAYQRQPDGSELPVAHLTAADGGDPTWQPQFPYYPGGHSVSQFCSPGGLDYYAINLDSTPGTNTLIGAD